MPLGARLLDALLVLDDLDDDHAAVDTHCRAGAQHVVVQLIADGRALRAVPVLVIAIVVKRDVTSPRPTSLRETAARRYIILII